MYFLGLQVPVDIATIYNKIFKRENFAENGCSQKTFMVADKLSTFTVKKYESSPS